MSANPSWGDALGGLWGDMVPYGNNGLAETLLWCCSFSRGKRGSCKSKEKGEVGVLGGGEGTVRRKN